MDRWTDGQSGMHLRVGTIDRSLLTTSGQDSTPVCLEQGTFETFHLSVSSDDWELGSTTAECRPRGSPTVHLSIRPYRPFNNRRPLAYRKIDSICCNSDASVRRPVAVSS